MQHGGWIVWQSELTQKVEIIIKVFAGTLAGIHNFHFIVYCEDAENWQMIASPGFYHEHWTKEKIEIHFLCCKDWKKLTLAKTIFVLTFIQFREVLANFYISRLGGQPTKRRLLLLIEALKICRGSVIHVGCKDVSWLFSKSYNNTRKVQGGFLTGPHLKS